MKYLIAALTLAAASIAFTAPASACYVWEARDGGACSKHD